MQMTFRFLKKQIEEILNAASTAAAVGGREICGLLIDNGYFVELLSVENKIKSGGGFAFYANEVRSSQKAANVLGHEIIGTFHSHPLYIDEPSDSDICNALDDSFMLIIDVMDQKVGLWHIKDGNKTRLEYAIIQPA